jgi:hypothetical protein
MTCADNHIALSSQLRVPLKSLNRPPSNPSLCKPCRLGMSLLGQKRISSRVCMTFALPPKADIVECGPVASRRKGRGGLRQESHYNSNGKPGTGCGLHWRELFCSTTPSASLFLEPIFRPQPTPVRSAYFGFLGAEPLDSDKPSTSKNVFSQAVFL